MLEKLAALLAKYGERAIEENLSDLDRYERALRAIAACPLLGQDFGDYVQSTVDSVLEGDEPECWECGTAVHEGACVSGGGESTEEQCPA